MLQLAARRCVPRRACQIPLRRLVSTTPAPNISKIKLLDDLTARGFIADVTRPDKLAEHLEQGKRTVYAGIDPTAPALHVGHLIPLMVLLHFQMRGHHVISLIGGATALVGDPSGRTEERTPVDPSVTEGNMHTLTEHLTSILHNALHYAKTRQPLNPGTPLETLQVMNNRSWLQNVGLLEFLQTVGSQVRVNTMLARESVRSRLESHKGVSFTEFTYQLLQAYDFLWLFKNRDCTIQVGGSDQWGNILAGLEMINREHSRDLTPQQSELPEQGFGITTPLLTTTSGQKFGKSAGNAVWLDANMTSVFDFYQFFLRTADADVEKQLLLLTFLPVENVKKVMLEHFEAPELRKAQTLLADEVTSMVHGERGMTQAHTITKIIFGSHNYHTLKASDIVAAFANDSRLKFVSEHDMHNETVGGLAVFHQLIPSKSEASRLVKAQGFYMNNQVMDKVSNKIDPGQLIDGRVAILRTGKSKHLILVVEQ